MSVKSVYNHWYSATYSSLTTKYASFRGVSVHYVWFVALYYAFDFFVCHNIVVPIDATHHFTDFNCVYPKLLYNIIGTRFRLVVHAPNQQSLIIGSHILCKVTYIVGRTTEIKPVYYP